MNKARFVLFGTVLLGLILFSMERAVCPATSPALGRA
jgi:hypothetical protein